MWICSLGGLVWLILPLVGGLVTGWWAWASAPMSEAVERRTDAGPVQPTPPAVRVAQPSPEVMGVTEEDPAPVPPPAAPLLTAIGIPAAIGPADDLLQIKGIGPKLNTLLEALGIQRFDQISAWDDADIARVDSHLGTFKGRITRDEWVTQADLLARGQIGEFEIRFGKLDSEIKQAETPSRA